MPLDIPTLVVKMAALIVALSVHEAAHAWAANRLGDPTARQLGRLTLNPLAHIDWIGTVLFPLIALYTGFPLLGWAKPVPVNMSNLRRPRFDFGLVALAGPVSNVLQALVGAAFFLVPAIASGTHTGTWYVAFMGNFVALNVLLAVFNMLPVPPLDGGNVLAGVAPEPVAKLIDFIRPFGFILLYALMLTGVLGEIMYPLLRAIDRWLP